jgi:hypothetical protein
VSVRPIIDAGPGLNFLSINRERLLIAILGALSAPEAVQDEVLRQLLSPPPLSSGLARCHLIQCRR